MALSPSLRHGDCPQGEESFAQAKEVTGDACVAEGAAQASTQRIVAEVHEEGQGAHSAPASRHERVRVMLPCRECEE